MTEKDLSDAPLPGHGETEASPKPEAKASRISDTAAATTAPAMIAPQDTADPVDSVEVCAVATGTTVGGADGVTCSVITRSIHKLNDACRQMFQRIMRIRAVRPGVAEL
jgi:hypothetical protein